MLSFNISYLDLIKFRYFANTLQGGTKDERKPKNKVKTW
jgi:hypothetical protein